MTFRHIFTATALTLGLIVAGTAIAHDSTGADRYIGRGMAPWMMNPGMMMNGGSGHMMPGMMGIGQGQMGHGMLLRDVSVEDVRHVLQHRIEFQGYGRLKVDKVEAKDKDTIIADIVTVDGHLVQRLEVNRHTLAMKEVNP